MIVLSVAGTDNHGQSCVRVGKGCPMLQTRAHPVVFGCDSRATREAVIDFLFPIRGQASRRARLLEERLVVREHEIMLHFIQFFIRLALYSVRVFLLILLILFLICSCPFCRRRV